MTGTRTVAGSPRRARRAVTAMALNQVRRGALLISAISAGMTALVAVQFQQTLAGSPDLLSLRTLAENPAISVLFGPPRALEDAGGFTVWRTGTVAAVLVAAWAIAAATAITRGEEDAGRWALLLAGPLTVRAVVARHLGVLLATQVVLALAVAVALLGSGTRAGGAVLHGVGIGAVGAFFTAVGVLAAQVLPERRSAAGAASGVLVATLLMRMVADGVDRLSWLALLSPFGLLGRSHAYSGDDALPIVVLVAYVVVLSFAATRAARRRDVGAGLVVLESDRPPRSRLLTSLPAFAVRRTLRPLMVWGAGVTAYFLLIGLLASSITQFLTDNRQFADLAAHAGFSELDTVEGYVASLFSILAVPVGLFAAGRIAADASDEEARRLAQVLSLPVRRQRWALVHAGVALLAGTLLGVVAGLATWLGAVAVGAPLTLGESLAGVLNIVPVAALGLGASVLAFGYMPNHVALAGAVPLVGGFLLLVVADSVGWTTLREVSPFAHIASVPVTTPDAVSTVVMLALTTAAVLAGARAFARRDVTA